MFVVENINEEMEKELVTRRWTLEVGGHVNPGPVGACARWRRQKVEKRGAAEAARERQAARRMAREARPSRAGVRLSNNSVSRPEAAWIRLCSFRSTVFFFFFLIFSPLVNWRKFHRLTIRSVTARFCSRGGCCDHLSWRRERDMAAWWRREDGGLAKKERDSQAAGPQGTQGLTKSRCGPIVMVSRRDASGV